MLKNLEVFFPNSVSNQLCKKELGTENYLQPPPGQRLHRFPFLYFLQHFFFIFFPSIIGSANGRRISLEGLITSVFLFLMIMKKGS